MRKFDKLKNIEKANILAEQRYLEKKGFVNESENKVITEETYDDLFHFLNTDPKKMTQGSVHYVADLNSSMNKNIVDDEGNKIPNPMYGKLFKHTRFMFKWEDTFTNAMERIDPNYVPGQRSGHYEKIDGYKVLEKGPNGLYLPILPTGSEYKIFVDNNGELEEMDKEAAKKFLRPASPTKTETPTKAAFRLLMLDKIAKVTGGGNVWKNPNFKGVYMGPGSNMSESNISEEKGINNIEAANQAFLDMKPEIEQKRKEEEGRLNPYRIKDYKLIPLDDKGDRGWDREVKDDGDSWVPGKSHVYTKDSKRLNRDL
jgi:hypothetical protein